MAKAAKAASEFKPPVSDESVRAKTGKGWDDWFKLLDDAGAAKLSHPEIVAIFASKYSKDVGPWWQQMLAVGYERARGLRETHETAAGFVVGASKTINASVDDVYDAWADGRRRARWLKGEKPSVRTSSHAKSMRLTWPDGSSVEVYFTKKGPSKTAVAVQHGKLENKNTVEKMKAYWKEQLEGLKASLEG
jgi:hypothetical protein